MVERSRLNATGLQVKDLDLIVQLGNWTCHWRLKSQN